MNSYQQSDNRRNKGGRSYHRQNHHHRNHHHRYQTNNDYHERNHYHQHNHNMNNSNHYHGSNEIYDEIFEFGRVHQYEFVWRFKMDGKRFFNQLNNLQMDIVIGRMAVICDIYKIRSINSNFGSKTDDNSLGIHFKGIYDKDSMNGILKELSDISDGYKTYPISKKIVGASSHLNKEKAQTFRDLKGLSTFKYIIKDCNVYIELIADKIPFIKQSGHEFDCEIPQNIGYEQSNYQNKIYLEIVTTEKMDTFKMVNYRKQLVDKTMELFLFINESIKWTLNHIKKNYYERYKALKKTISENIEWREYEVNVLENKEKFVVIRVIMIVSILSFMFDIQFIDKSLSSDYIYQYIQRYHESLKQSKMYQQSSVSQISCDHVHYSFILSCSELRVLECNKITNFSRTGVNHQMSYTRLELHDFCNNNNNNDDDIKLDVSTTTNTNNGDNKKRKLKTTTPNDDEPPRKKRKKAISDSIDNQSTTTTTAATSTATAPTATTTPFYCDDASHAKRVYFCNADNYRQHHKNFHHEQPSQHPPKQRGPKTGCTYPKRKNLDNNNNNNNI